MSGSLPVALL